MSKKDILGQIAEIKTNHGFVYLQHIQDNDELGELVRVIEGFYEERPADFTGIVIKKDRFLTFFPFKLAIRKKLIEIVAIAEIPEQYSKPPLFKNPGVRDPKTGKSLAWWLWDGKAYTSLGKDLPKKYYDLPFAQICNLEMIKDRVEKNWIPSQDISILGREKK